MDNSPQQHHQPLPKAKSPNMTTSRKLFPPLSRKKLPPKPPVPSSSSLVEEGPTYDPFPAVASDDLSNSFLPDFSMADLNNLSESSASFSHNNNHSSSSTLNASPLASSPPTSSSSSLGQQHPTTTLDGFLERDDSSSPRTSSSCLPVAPILWRRNSSKKVNSTDVASVGNASDTVVDNVRSLSGRDLHEQAKLRLNAGDYDQALELFESVLSAQVGRFGPVHPSVGAAMHNVGVCRQRMQHDELAENLFMEAAQIRIQTLGREHLDVAASLSKLGATRASLGKFEEGFANLRQALQIARRQLGYEHKTVAQLLCHMACFYLEKGELFAAHSTFQDAYEIYRLVWPNAADRNGCMAQMTDTLCNIGSIQNRRKQHADAIKTFSEALDLQLGIMGHDHPRVVATLDNLAYSYSKNKEHSKALGCYKKMLTAQLSKSRTFSNACFETFRKQILMYQKLKQIQEAIEATKETLRLQKSTLPRDHKIIVQTKDLLDDLNSKLKRRNSSSQVVK